MGRIVTSVTITNVKHSEYSMRCDALVDTGAAALVLPKAWQERLGPLELIHRVEFETATQTTVTGEICGPVQIQLEGFRPLYNEVVFVEMTPENGTYQPLVGYIILEQSQAAVDMVGHRLLHVKKMDLKIVARSQ
jgi:predicted aspartyl protease